MGDGELEARMNIVREENGSGSEESVISEGMVSRGVAMENGIGRVHKGKAHDG